MPNEWIECRKQLPPVGTVVETKLDDAGGVRNEQDLVRGGTSGGLWFMPDYSMYVYYNPTHWKFKEEVT